MSGRPDRSDTHLTPEEEVRREAEARDYFDGIAPKRHSKPSRSDFSSVYADALPPSCRDDSIPEHHKFQHLEANSLQKLVCDGSEVVEEYVETEYYDDLNCVDKQHHTLHLIILYFHVCSFPGDYIYIKYSCPCSFHFAWQTGTGFIRMEKSNGSSFQITPDTDASDGHVSCRGNPATNEWIPSADTVVPTSHKPNRSDV